MGVETFQECLLLRPLQPQAQVQPIKEKGDELMRLVMHPTDLRTISSIGNIISRTQPWIPI